MTLSENAIKRLHLSSAVGRRMLVGGGIALALICIFVLGAGEGSPAWGPYWRIKPLLLTPFLGGLIGLCYDLTEPLRQLNGWQGKLFFILSLLSYAIGLWISLVLGLNGTMWN